MLIVFQESLSFPSLEQMFALSVDGYVPQSGYGSGIQKCDCGGCMNVCEGNVIDDIMCA
jgi:hypothetical protein